jgi:hypothetical protein
VDEIRDRRAAENENLFRRINERVEELSAGLDELALVCECTDPACADRLPPIPVAEYERVRANPQRFLVANGHERDDVETVVERRSGYLIVEERGEAGRVARHDDPRSD